MSKNSCDICDKSFDVVSLARMVIDNGVSYKYCRNCCSPAATAIPDVYYGYGSGTHFEENIADPATGKPIPFSSKREKWEAMKKAGVRELGDKVKGMRNESHLPSKRKTYFI